MDISSKTVAKHATAKFLAHPTRFPRYVVPVGHSFPFKLHYVCFHGLIVERYALKSRVAAHKLNRRKACDGQISGAPDAIRTRNPRLRRAMLYPVKPRVQHALLYAPATKMQVPIDHGLL